MEALATMAILSGFSPVVLPAAPPVVVADGLEHAARTIIDPTVSDRSDFKNLFPTIFFLPPKYVMNNFFLVQSSFPKTPVIVDKILTASQPWRNHD
jgi:hypothetical protein